MKETLVCPCQRRQFFIDLALNLNLSRRLSSICTAHVRLCSVARKVAPEVVLRDDISSINTRPLSEPKVHEIIMLLATYPDVVRSALK